MTVAQPCVIPQQEKPVTSAVSPTRSLVPALIGRPGRAQVIHIECPTSWCRVNHAENREVAVEDITHYGPGTSLTVGSMFDDATAVHEWYVNITSDPAHEDSRMRAAHLVVSNAGPDDAHLADAQGEELADELERVAMEIRQALRICRQANQAAAA